MYKISHGTAEELAAYDELLQFLASLMSKNQNYHVIVWEHGYVKTTY
jgi:hypothetical protein